MLNPTRATHTVDAKDRILGRVATEIAGLLRGKGKVGFTYNQDLGDKVIVLNADLVKVSGKKATAKKYYRHSSYPGGLREITFDKLQAIHPDRIIRLAVTNMLPDNRLRDRWLARLEIKTSKENA